MASHADLGYKPAPAYHYNIAAARQRINCPTEPSHPKGTRAMAPTPTTSPFQTRVGHLGNPNSADPFKFWRVVPWTYANLQRLSDLGFNTIQVNVAWGPRPDDEPLNIEDVVELPPDLAAQYPQVVPLNCDPSPERRQQRHADVRERSA